VPPGFRTRSISATATRGAGEHVSELAEYGIECRIGKWQLFCVPSWKSISTRRDWRSPGGLEELWG